MDFNFILHFISLHGDSQLSLLHLIKVTCNLLLSGSWICIIYLNIFPRLRNVFNSIFPKRWLFLFVLLVCWLRIEFCNNPLSLLTCKWNRGSLDFLGSVNISLALLSTAALIFSAAALHRRIAKTTLFSQKVNLLTWLHFGSAHLCVCKITFLDNDEYELRWISVGWEH